MTKTEAVSEYMKRIGRKGGKATTPAKSRASRLNLAKARKVRCSK